jgi:hypothetical protein
MKKRTKLAIRREILRALTNIELAHAAGGDSGAFNCPLVNAVDSGAFNCPKPRV